VNKFYKYFFLLISKAVIFPSVF